VVRQRSTRGTPACSVTGVASLTTVWVQAPQSGASDQCSAGQGTVVRQGAALICVSLSCCLCGAPQVDRCVTGLIAQQQTVGPLQITLADVAVIAQVSGLAWLSLKGRRVQQQLPVSKTAVNTCHQHTVL